MPNRLFFFVVIGAIVVVLAIMGIIVWIQGDNEDQGEDTGPPGHAAPSLVHDYVSGAWRTGTA
jgi:hypothetical protein